MNQEPPTIEEELRNLQAAPLDEALLARLEASAEGTWTELTRDELRLEELLRQALPARLSPDFLAELESVTRGVHFAVNEKILLFPHGTSAAKTRTRHRPMWAAAAAVAVIGATSALLMPTREVAKTASAGVLPGPPPATANTTRNFVPATFNRGLSAVHDEGVIWKSNTEPQRVVRVVYMDLITLKDDHGRTLEVEQPRVEYMLVPARTD